MIFVNTGAFLARYMKNDQYHRSARETWEDLRENSSRLFTSNLVLAELFTLLARRDSYTAAVVRARSILASGSFEILRSGIDEEWEAVRFFEKYADQQVGYTDCVSFALMRRRGIKRVFSFDRHFEGAGFQLLT